MRRKALVWNLSLILGIVSSHFISIPEFLAAGAFLLAVLAVYLLFSFVRSHMRKTNLLIGLCILFFVVGGVWGYRFTFQKEAAFSPFTGHYVTATAVLKSDPQISRNEASLYDILTYTAEITLLEFDGREYSPHEPLKLTFYDSDRENAYQYGDIIRFDGVIQKIKTASSFGEFDNSAFLKANGIFYEMSLDWEQSTFLSKDQSRSLDNYLYTFRARLSQNADAVLSGDEAALTKALILGERSSLSEEEYDAFRLSGLAHVLAVSGLHVSILLSLVIGFLSLLRAKKLLRNFIAAVFLLLFVLVSGASPSVVRAVVCAVIYLVAESIGEEPDRLIALSIAAGGMLLINPYVCFDLSFLLTFLCALGIYLFYSPLKKCLRFLKFSYLIDTLAMTVASQTLIFPILLSTFGYFQPLTLISNLMVLFFMPVILLSCMAVLAVGAVPLLGTAAGAVCFSFLNYLSSCAHLIARVPVIESEPLPAVLLIGYALGLWIFYRLLRRRSMRGNALILLSIFFILTLDTVWQSCSKDVIITFVNVGQGDAAVIELPNGQTAVIDGGGRNYDKQADKGLRVFLPFLEKKGIAVIDYAFVSHFDNDHALGIVHALESEDLTVLNLILPYRVRHDHVNEQKLLGLAKEKGINVLYFSAGDELSFTDSSLIFRTLSPDKNAEYPDENSASLILELQYGEVSCLFTGDAEKEILNSLAGQIEDCELVKVPHHGAAGGAALEFYQAAAPEYAIIQTGKNTFGHPSNETLSLLNGIGAEVYRTDLCGDIKVILTPRRMKRIEPYLKN